MIILFPLYEIPKKKKKKKKRGGGGKKRGGGGGGKKKSPPGGGGGGGGKKGGGGGKRKKKKGENPPLGGDFFVGGEFVVFFAQTKDSPLGLRGTMFGYQYSEILRSLSVYLVVAHHLRMTTHLMKHLSHPNSRFCPKKTKKGATKKWLLRASHLYKCPKAMISNRNGTGLLVLPCLLLVNSNPGKRRKKKKKKKKKKKGGEEKKKTKRAV
ncbi:hypothetical protein [Parabacteroides distasonis]|uniref:hypothetical protein n=1 Tax=Parabacteroides distasonis TaxID=823 RepID=UPI00404076AD